MEKIIKQALLYDFYGELLTQHQKSVYEDYALNDIGISEIASEQGISRQGVHDLIKRCDKLLEGYEEKLHLVDKFIRTKELVNEIKELTVEFKETKNAEKNDININEMIIDKISRISEHILEEL